MKNISKTFFDKPVFFMTIHMIITVVLSFVIISITTTNISGLDKFITERTHTYAKDVSLQLAADITTEFETRKMSMAMVADSIKNTLQTM